MPSLLSHAQLGQIGNDLAERRGYLACGCQQVELVRAARAILRQGRRGIAAGVDLNRIQHNVGDLTLSQVNRLACVDRGLTAVAAVVWLHPMLWKRPTSRVP